MRLPGVLLPTALAALLIGDPLGAAEVTLIGPVFSQLVAMPGPDGFTEGDETTRGPAYLHELIPRGESLGAWSQMITLSGARGAARGAPAQDAAGFAGGIAAGYRAACPDSFAALSFDAPRVRGARATFAAFLGCGQVSGGPQSESMLMIVLVGRHDIYTLQWAERGPATAAAPRFDPARWQARFDRLVATARLCDPVAGEGPPYPSCTGG